MTVTEAVEKVKNGEYALFLDNDNIQILNIVLINAFKKKEIRKDYGPDKYFYGNQVQSIWRACHQNIFVKHDKVIKVSDIGIAWTPPLNNRPGLNYHEILASARELQVEELQHVTDLETLRLLIVGLKKRELVTDIKHQKLLTKLDEVLDEETLLKIFG